MAAAADRGVFPVRSVTHHADVCGVPTDFVLSAFSNRIFVVVSQTQTLGTLIHAWHDNPVEAPSASSFSTRILLGRRDDETLEVYARTLIELISKRSRLPLLLSISITDRSSAMFRAVMQELDAIKVW